jgi:penicillin amidase
VPNDSPSGRAATAYAADSDRLSEAAARLATWGAAGFQARSGVQTFYNTPSAASQEDAVATMIYYAWQGAVVEEIVGDEGLLDALWRPYPASGIPRLLRRMLDGRGPSNPEELASWLEETQESAFFDVLGTEQVEGSDEVLIGALTKALDALEAPSSRNGEGGFGTDDPAEWLWGLRHTVRFESILADALGDMPLLAPLTRAFAITTEVFGLDEDIPLADPRRELLGFPRDGGPGSVDQAGHGFDTEDFSYTNGPAFRMVFSLGPDGVQGFNVLPGGQSAIIESPHFSDQAELWLGNQTIRMRYTLDDVVAGAQARWTFE